MVVRNVVAGPRFVPIKVPEKLPHFLVDRSRAVQELALHSLFLAAFSSMPRRVYLADHCLNVVPNVLLMNDYVLVAIQMGVVLHDPHQDSPFRRLPVASHSVGIWDTRSFPVGWKTGLPSGRIFRRPAK